jgi:hypothetical protein
MQCGRAIRLEKQSAKSRTPARIHETQFPAPSRSLLHTCQQAARYVRFPSTDLEVKIVLPIPLRVGSGRGWSDLWKCRKGMPEIPKHAQQTINSKTPKRVHCLLQVHDSPLPGAKANLCGPCPSRVMLSFIRTQVQDGAIRGN